LTTSTFVGRDRELAQLDACLANAESGTPQLVLIHGDPGVGKSALVASFLGMHGSLTPLTVAGDDAETDLPFGVCDLLLSDDTLVDCGASIPRSPFSVGASVLQLVGLQQSDGPAVLVIDDAHLVDPESLHAVTFALRRLRADRVLALLTARTDEMSRLPPGLLRLVDEGGLRLRLGGFCDTDVVELGLAAGCGRLSVRAAARLRAHTGGSPLHLRALMAELPAVDLHAVDGPLPAPRSFGLLVLGSLASTSAAAQRLAGAAAVLHEPVRVHDLALVAGIAEPLAGLEELQRARILHLSPSRDGWRSEFDHTLVRAAVHDDLGPATRAELHSRAAELLGGRTALAHRAAAAAGSDPLLVTLLEQSAQKHKLAGNPRAASDALLDAARLSTAGPAADRLLLDAVELLLLTGDVVAALAYSERISGMPPTALRLHVQARLALLSGCHDEARARALQAWERGEDLEPAARDEVAAMLTHIAVMRNEGAAAAEWASQALATGRLAPDQAVMTRGAAAVALAISGRPDDGLRLLDELPEDPWTAGPERNDELRVRGTLRLWTDDLRGARADLIASGSTTHGGLFPYRLPALAYLLETEYRLGNWDDSLAVAEQAVSLIQDMEQFWLAGSVHAMAVFVPAGRGLWAEAERHLHVAREAASAVAEQATPHYIANAAVHLAACRGDSARVIAEAALLLASGPGAPHEPGIFAWPVHHAAALVDLRQFDEAAARLDVLESVARQRKRRSRLAALARVRGELAAARRQSGAAREAFETAMQLGEGSADVLERAAAHAAYGRFLRRRGERRAAAGQLQAARESFVRLGARPFLDRCDSELDACGVSPRPRVQDGADLTPQERAVTRLVCAGRSNQEVAAELVLSVKTVDYHLGHVYTKLVVHSRTQLIARLAGTPNETPAIQQTSGNPSSQ
jgi:DNA-binding CsgD family transcriptional regulator/tetratricopeptide (TPR) repeat protein